MLKLITIPVSHYCEKARWALDRAGIRYREEGHLQVFHYLATLRTGGIKVPVLVHAGGALPESTAIMRWADAQGGASPLFPEIDGLDRLVRRLDDELGPASRLWAYHELLPARELMLRYATSGAPAWEGRAFGYVFSAGAGFLRWRLGVTPSSARRARDECLRTFDAIADRLRDGRRYLFGDTFTAADLTFAALAAPIVFPERYGGPLPPLAEVPSAYRHEVSALREHPAGRHVLRVYEENR